MLNFKSYLKYKLNYFLKLDFFKSLTYISFSTFIRLVMGFVSIKAISIFIGPSGLAAIGQISNFTLIIVQLSTFGISNGIVNYVSLYKNRPIIYNYFLKGAIHISFILSFLIFLILFFFPKKISNLVFQNQEYFKEIILLSFLVFFFSISTIIQSVINGLKEYKKYASLNIFSSIFGVLSMIILIYFFKLKGAIINVIILPFFVTFFYLLKYEKKIRFFNHFKKISNEFSYKISKKYISFSIITLVSSLCTPIVMFYIRGVMINKYGFVIAGNWEAINRISNVYMSLFSTTFMVYLLPKFSENLNGDDFKDELFLIFKYMNVIIIFLFSLLFIFKDLIIKIVLNNSFDKVSEYFIWQLIGDLFKMNSWILSILMISKQLVKKFVIVEVCTSAAYLLLSIICINYFNSTGSVIAYTISSAITLFMLTILNYKTIKK